MDLFSHPSSFLDAFQKRERKWWRRFLQVGGRSPNAAVQILMGVPSCTITWRVRRAALFVKLANAPAGSWRHLAFIAHHNLQSPWFVATFSDVLLVLPGVRLVPTFVGTEPFLSSSGKWSDFGQWLSLHAYSLPINANGLRYRPPERLNLQRKWSSPVRKHAYEISHQLQLTLTREFSSVLYSSVVDAALASESSKLGFLAQRLQSAGLPLHLALDLILVPSHRAAVASFFCGDWFFGKYAHNYFAKLLLPSTVHHLSLARDANVNSASVCLACWHFRRQLFLEDEYHVACVCPAYSGARADLLLQLGPTSPLNTGHQLLHTLSGNDPLTFQAVGRFLVRARQVRMRLKLTFERLNHKLETRSFAAKRIAWRFRRKHACRHGVLFTNMPPGGCKCMSVDTSDQDWDQARFMPALDHELKSIIAVPFDLSTYERLGSLQSQARRLGW